jgi:hypothetical protein
MSRVLQPANEHVEFRPSIRAAVFASVALEETPAALTPFSPTSEIVPLSIKFADWRLPRSSLPFLQGFSKGA